LAASYRTANCSRGPKAPVEFRRDGDVREDRRRVSRGGPHSTVDSSRTASTTYPGPPP